ncbi:hypothetical protein sscle_01g004480 [Sclerotinia sclerotiorum 1980 UF-70]|uniref:Glycosyltransferase family 69 protein n=1 Tax=Sclerotinia sclerotiorum (strain ATCC 18683 / 1980 / Ss-1) TaxID=665079 RepID=A0A1D9PSG9_SCLS1|nr:hypothetical protein sscle_01g004480 [Sclerotinia sclerotiorum 1980 UF-70]
MTFLPRRYLRAPRSPLHPHSRLPNLCLAILVFFLLDAYWIVINLPRPIRIITPPYSAIAASTLTSNQHESLSLPGQDSPSMRRVGGEGDQESLLSSDIENDVAFQGFTPQMGNPNNETIFIAAIFRTSEIMLKQNWSPALISLVQHLGPKNVYVSIVESGSWDGTKAALMDLDGMLNEAGVERTVELGMDRAGQLEELKHVPEEDRTGWLFTERKESESGWEMRRIPYLARLRNKAMEPLLRVWDEGRGRKFDKILWINDVVFTTTDVTTLLATNNNSYAAACSLDFSRPYQYYDTFALRDSSGRKTSSLSWPYFYSPQSLNAIKRNEPVPVKSCWNGMVVFDGEPWYPSSSSNQQGIHNEQNNNFKGLQFRGVEDSLAEKHVEGSECCLIHADNPLRDRRGVYVNPNVRVAYKREVYEVVNGRGGGPGKWEGVRGVWGLGWDGLGSGGVGGWRGGGWGGECGGGSRRGG